MRRFQKFFAGALSVSLIAASMFGCGAFAEETETAADVETAAETVGESTGTRTIVDHTGAEVVLPTEIKRVVISSILPLPSVYCLFRGSADDLVGIHPSSMAAAQNSYLINVYPEIADVDTSFVENGEVNIEQLLSLEPDVVFYAAGNTDERAMYDNAGIPAVGFSTSMAEYDCVETYADWIELLGEIYGEQDTANAIIEEGRAVAEQIKSVTDTIDDADKPKVLILFNYDNGTISTSGSNFFGQYWIETAGGINVAEELSANAEINMEQIYEWNPDIIFITNFSACQPEDLYNNAIEGDDWSNVAAVKNQQVYKFPLGMYRWFPPASDTPLVLKWLATKIQPEKFADVDMDQEIKDYYEKYYNVELTDEDLQEIYNPARAAAGK